MVEVFSEPSIEVTEPVVASSELRAVGAYGVARVFRVVNTEQIWGLF